MISILKEVVRAIEGGNEAPTVDIIETICLALEPSYYDVEII